MWMFLKVVLAMSAAAGVAAVPSVLLPHHSQTNAEGQISVQSNSNMRTSANQAGSSGMFSMQGSGGGSGTLDGKTVTVNADGNSTSSWSFTFPGFNTEPPTSVTAQPSQPSNPTQGETSNSKGTVTWGKVQTIGNGQMTVVNGKSSATFTVNGDTRVVCISGPMRAIDENAGVDRVKPGDIVMVLSRMGTAVQIIDRGKISGKYLPLGGGGLPSILPDDFGGGAQGGSQSAGADGSLQGNATGSLQAGGAQGSFSGSLSIQGSGSVSGSDR